MNERATSVDRTHDRTHISVLVPTYRRPIDIARCLIALQWQTCLPHQVIVVMRSDDARTREQLEQPNVRGALRLDVITVDVPGQVAALNCGLDRATGEVIAITDDDAAPRTDWLERIATAFSMDARLGALGGRDWVHEKGRVLDDERHDVGRLTMLGKVIGNHHLGAGVAREVDVLKGANMSYRRSAIEGIRFDERLRGNGAQAHNDMAFSMSVKRAGWKLVYDPLVAVDHYPAARVDEARDTFLPASVRDAAHNFHLTLREHLPRTRSAIAWWWYALVGTRVYPGLAHLLLALASHERAIVCRRWLAARLGAHDARRVQVAR